MAESATSIPLVYWGYDRSGSTLYRDTKFICKYHDRISYTYIYWGYIELELLVSVSLTVSVLQYSHSTRYRDSLYIPWVVGGWASSEKFLWAHDIVWSVLILIKSYHTNRESMLVPESSCSFFFTWQYITFIISIIHIIYVSHTTVTFIIRLYTNWPG